MQNEKGIDEVKATIVVLNSTALKKNLVELVLKDQFPKIYFFLDNDESGDETLNFYNEALNKSELIDMSHLYSTYKDFNEWFCKQKA